MDTWRWNRLNRVAIIQARMGSTRLPGKTLEDLEGSPLLEHVVRRTAQARRVDAVVVATTREPRDDVVVSYCEQTGVACFRGSEADVLDRYRQVADATSADVIVRITADCPFIDPAIIDLVIERFCSREGMAYVSNVNPPTYPDGLDVEVFSREALETAWREASLTFDREHVTPYIRNRSDHFLADNVCHEHDLSHLRWTVDEERDLEFVRQIHKALGTPDFGLPQILALLEDRPELLEINQGIRRNAGFEPANDTRS